MFALAIPLLPEPTRNRVGIAYLLFRIADTFEDAVLISSAASTV
jgi:phytoene/squalene synthetase